MSGHSCRKEEAMELNKENSFITSGSSYYDCVQRELESYANSWKLSQFELIKNGSESCVLKCLSKDYGKVILKMNKSVKVIEDEYNTLVEYNGRGFCRPYQADLVNGALLEEQIHPGTELRKVSSLDERLHIFCSIHQGLHIPSSKPTAYKSYLDWVTRITRYMASQKDYPELFDHMKIAESLCKQLFLQYPSVMLLHGDLHHDNILLNSNHGYTIIDPKGILGDPIFDVPRFILNEMEEDLNQELYDKINYIITSISKNLHIPIDVLKQCFFIEMAMAECWNVEDSQQANINNVRFVKRILENEN